MTRTAQLDVRRGIPPYSPDRTAPLSPRRRLQLALAGFWVLDGLLKLQPFMFTKDFGPMTLGRTADGAPGWLAGPIRWASGLMQGHPVRLMMLCALGELAIGFGIAWPRTLRPALVACMIWVPLVWFFAEGLGGLASGSPSAFDGAPGASLLYGLLALLLWPTGSDEAKPGRAAAAAAAAPVPGGPGEASRFVGARAAKAVWIALWGTLALLAFLPSNRAPGAFADVIAGKGANAPVWYGSLLEHAAAWASGRGGELGTAFGVALALVALSVLAPWRHAVRAGMVLAMALSAVIWVFGEGFGLPFTGMSTDPDTAPLLSLLALSYWPSRRRRTANATAIVPGGPAPRAAAA